MRCKLFRWGMFLLICSVFFVIPEAHAIDTKVRVGFVPEQASYYFYMMMGNLPVCVLICWNILRLSRDMNWSIIRQKRAQIANLL